MAESENELGVFLKDRRARLDPAQFGLPLQRRRTPGLRREEVAQRAHVSATWYTWLEQGRGGAPSADVLDRLSRALSLSPVEREHLFLLAQHRPPKATRVEQSPITPQLQRVLDALVDSPALLKTPNGRCWGGTGRRGRCSPITRICPRKIGTCCAICFFMGGMDI